MKYIDEFRESEVAKKLVAEIRRAATRDQYRLMEVCGTHTVSVYRSGIRSLLPPNVRLISGPGCPVCVTPNRDIDRAIAMTEVPGVVVATFGDMVKVPGSRDSLERARARGARVFVAYSPAEAVMLAERERKSQIVLLGVGFETTAPTIAATVKMAREKGLSNFTVFSCHKLVPPAMEALVADGEVGIDGFLCAGHVTAIIGSNAYRKIAEHDRVPCVVSGFEPLDILLSVLWLIRQVNEERSEVEVEYSRVVSLEGNPKAVGVMMEVFQTVDSEWRGIGVIPATGLAVRPEFRSFDAAVRFPVEVPPPRENPGCICGAVIKGAKEPRECRLFGEFCTPEEPVGPCMVSTEGTCAACYKYGGYDGAA